MAHMPDKKVLKTLIPEQDLHSNSHEGNPQKCWIKSLKWQPQWSCLQEVLQGPKWIQPISNEPGDAPTP